MHPQRILVQSSGAALLLWVYVFSLNAQTPRTECFTGPKDPLGVIQAQDRQLGQLIGELPYRSHFGKKNDIRLLC